MLPHAIIVEILGELMDKGVLVFPGSLVKQVLVLVSQLVVVILYHRLYRMTINTKATFFNGSNLPKTIPNLSPLLSYGFEICPY